jgi:hypothetical protein
MIIIIIFLQKAKVLQTLTSLRLGFLTRLFENFHNPS